jgi:tRNA wybutosine-synthesizing protein 3
MLFDKQKKDCLARIDKSQKKTIDKDIKPLIDLINSLKDYYTTSSCSGRILLIEKKTDKLLNSKNSKDLGKSKIFPSKKDIRFAFAEHKTADFKAIKKNLEKLSANDIWLKQESIIMHVCCRNLEAAKKLLKIVRDLGIKRAGLITVNKRIIIEIIGTEAMETIIARKGKMLIDDDYLKILVKESNKKLERNEIKIKELYKVISSSSSV